MKTYIFLLTLVLINACNTPTEQIEVTNAEEESIEEAVKTAKVTIGDVGQDVTIQCKISTQYFGSNKETDNFSVVCQQDEPLHILQMTFANEAEARSEKSLSVKGGSYKVNSGEYSLEYSSPDGKQFVAKSESSGSLKVQNNKIYISDYKLYDSDKNERIIDAEIEF